MTEEQMGRFRDILAKLNGLFKEIEDTPPVVVPPVVLPDPVPVPPPVEPKPPVAGQLRFIVGPTALQPGDGRYIPASDLREAKAITALTIRVRPSEIHPDRDVWKFDRIDTSVKNAKAAGKKYKILLMSGDEGKQRLPAFVGGQMVNGYPVPWNPEAIAYWKDCLDRLAKRYNDDLDFCGIHVPGLTDFDTSEEKFLDPAWEKQAGYSDKKVVDAHLDLITYMTRIFPNIAIYYAIGANAARYMDDIIAGAAKVCREGQFYIKNNAVKFGADLKWAGITVLTNALKLFPSIRLAGEMVGRTDEDKDGKPRTGSRDINECYKYWANVVAKQGGRGPKEVQLDIYPPDIKAVKSL